MKSLLSLSVILLLTAACTTQAAAPAKPPGKKTVTAELVTTKDTYNLDPAQAGKPFRDKLDLIKRTGPAPKTPAVDLILRLTNNTEEPVTIILGGDQSNIVFTLKGPGAVTITPSIAMTMDFRMGNAVNILPGKTHDIAITSLSGGPRGISQYSYWTEPGDYTLAATLTAATIDEKQLKFSTDPAKIKVAGDEKK